MSGRSIINDFADSLPQTDVFNSPLAFVFEMRPEGVYSKKLTEPQLIFVCEGEVSVTDLSGAELSLAEGNFTLIVPGDFVSFKALEDSEVLVCRLRSERQLYERLNLANLANFNDGENMDFLHVNEDLQIFLNGFIHFLKKGFSSVRYHDGKIAELLYILRETYSKTDLAALFLPLLGTELAFKNFVFSTVRKVNSVSEMAAMANMSATGFRSKFVKIIGASPSDVILRYKADMIKQDLLFTDIPLKEISEKYGFNSIHVFTRFCTRQLGTSPGNLRKSVRMKRE